MIVIFKKELTAFLSSLIGYIAICVFLITTGLFIWVFPETNVLNSNEASLSGFFFIAPWILLFLIPAITMRMISEEKQTGTIELLATKPVSDWEIVLGKFFAAWLLVLFALIPTFIYYIGIDALSLKEMGSLDTGATIGSYLGLFFMSACFVAIGLFASSITSNQIVAFLSGVFLNFFFFSAFTSISRLQVFSTKLDYFIEQIGIMNHYQSISLGVLDIKDFVYFISFVILFLAITKTVLDARNW